MLNEEPDYESYGLMPVAKKATANEPDFASFGLTPVAKNKSSNPILNLANKQWDIETNVAKDVFDVAKKLPGEAIETVGKIPEFAEYLKENIPAAGKLIMNNPKAAGKEALAGISEEAGKISRIPPAVVDYLAKIGMINPERAKEFARPFSEEESKRAADKFVGEEQPGGGLIRGAGRNMDVLYGASKLAGLANPMRYTKSAIANDVLKTEAKQIATHQKAYNDLWKEAHESGYGKVRINPEKIKMDTIKNYPNDDYYASVEKFMKNPTIENAHTAQSDLGKMVRQLRKNPTIVAPSESNNLRKAAKEARSYIRSQMFRNENGILNQNFRNEKGIINKKLSDQYNSITKSYRENVIPYSTNRALQKYKMEESTLEELIPGLKTGKFARKKGSAHPELIRADQIKNLLKGSGYLGGGVAGLAGADYLIKLLRGNQERP